MNKQTLFDRGFKYPIGIFVSIVMLSMIIFGIIVVHDLGVIEASLYKIFVTSCENFNIPNISAIFSLVRKLYVIITSTILVFLVVWLYIWFNDKPFYKN